MVLKRRLNPIYYSIELDDEHYLLICTDGLSNKVDEQLMQEIVLSDATLREKAKELVDLANKMGGEDNISVILLDSSEVGGE